MITLLCVAILVGCVCVACVCVVCIFISRGRASRRINEKQSVLRGHQPPPPPHIRRVCLRMCDISLERPRKSLFNATLLGRHSCSCCQGPGTKTLPEWCAVPGVCLVFTLTYITAPICGAVVTLPFRASLTSTTRPA